MERFLSSVQDLVVQTSSNLPADVREAMSTAMRNEVQGSQAASALDVIATNIDMAESGANPICQDTGMPTFEIKTPAGANQIRMAEEIRKAVAEATRRGSCARTRWIPLRAKTAETTSDRARQSYISTSGRTTKKSKSSSCCKGGGCENKNIQYSVPCELPHLGRADRNLDGVRKCILHAVWQAQGQGCSAGRYRGVHRRGPHFRLSPCKGAVVPDPGRHEPGPSTCRARGIHTLGIEHSRDRDDGVWRCGDAVRLQGGRAQPTAGQFLRLRGVRLLGIPAPRRSAGRPDRCDQALALQGGLRSPSPGWPSVRVSCPREGDCSQRLR